MWRPKPKPCQMVACCGRGTCGGRARLGQVCAAERQLRPIRAYTKGLEDLVPRADRDALLADKDRLQQEVDALRRVEQELRAALARAALAQQARPVRPPLPRNDGTLGSLLMAATHPSRIWVIAPGSN